MKGEGVLSGWKYRTNDFQTSGYTFQYGDAHGDGTVDREANTRCRPDRGTSVRPRRWGYRLLYNNDNNVSTTVNTRPEK